VIMSQYSTVRRFHPTLSLGFIFATNISCLTFCLTFCILQMSSRSTKQNKSSMHTTYAYPRWMAIFEVNGNFQMCRMQITEMWVQMGYSKSKSHSSSLFAHYHRKLSSCSRYTKTYKQKAISESADKILSKIFTFPLNFARNFYGAVGPPTQKTNINLAVTSRY